MLMGCGAHGVSAITPPPEHPGFVLARIDPPEGLPPMAPLPFRLQPGDVVTLRTLSVAPMEAARLGVDDAGQVHVPLLGAIPVVGASLEEAEARLEEKLRRYDHFGRVSLVVVEPAGHAVSALGALEKPGRYLLAGGTRVADLVAMAGGLGTTRGEPELTALADAEAARLVRGGQTLPISLTRALEGDLRHNVPLLPGDLLLVPALQGAAVRVLGEVRAARTVPWRPGLRLSEALARAGGLSPEADTADVRVIRGPLSQPRIYQARFAELLQGQAPDVELLRGDLVFVSRHWFATATDVLQRLTPLLAATAAVATAATLLPISPVSPVPK